LHEQQEREFAITCYVSLTFITTVIIVRILKDLAQYLDQTNEIIPYHKTFCKNDLLLLVVVVVLVLVLVFMFDAGIILGHRPVNMVG
jgi:hypothetical protein